MGRLRRHCCACKVRQNNRSRCTDACGSLRSRIMLGATRTAAAADHPRLEELGLFRLLPVLLEERLANLAELVELGIGIT